MLDYVKSLKGCENLVDHLSVQEKGDNTSTVHDKKVMFDEHLSLYDIKMGIKSNRFVIYRTGMHLFENAAVLITRGVGALVKSILSFTPREL